MARVVVLLFLASPAFGANLHGQLLRAPILKTESTLPLGGSKFKPSLGLALGLRGGANRRAQPSSSSGGSDDKQDLGLDLAIGRAALAIRDAACGDGVRILVKQCHLCLPFTGRGRKLWFTVVRAFIMQALIALPCVLVFPMWWCVPAFLRRGLAAPAAADSGSIAKSTTLGKTTSCEEKTRPLTSS